MSGSKMTATIIGFGLAAMTSFGAGIIGFPEHIQAAVGLVTIATVLVIGGNT